jgi:hypothetical protein
MQFADKLSSSATRLVTKLAVAAAFAASAAAFAALSLFTEVAFVLWLSLMLSFRLLLASFPS